MLDSATGFEPSGRPRFEAVMDELAHANRLTILNKVYRAVAWSMLTGRGCRFREGEDGLDALLQHPRFAGAKLCVVTLNYDILTEEALCRLGRKFYYPGVSTEQESTGVQVYKLHGSINWRQVTAIGIGATIEIARENANRNRIEYGTALGHSRLTSRETGGNYIPPDGRTNLILTLKNSHNTADAIMAIYGTGKPVATNPTCLERVRKSCLSFIQQQGDADVTIIGVRPPSGQVDDPTLAQLFDALSKTSGRRHYVGPAIDHCDAARDMGFDPWRLSMHDFCAQ